MRCALTRFSWLGMMKRKKGETKRMPLRKYLSLGKRWVLERCNLLLKAVFSRLPSAAQAENLLLSFDQPCDRHR